MNLGIMTKYVFRLLCLVLCVFSLEVGGQQLGPLTFEIADGQVTITDCSQSAKGELTIPAEIDGLPVTSIGDNAFSYCTSLTSITIGNNVTSIGNDVFIGCLNLKSVRIPEQFATGDEANRIGDAFCIPLYQNDRWGPNAVMLTTPQQPPATPITQPSIRMAPVIMVQGEEGSVKTIEVADSPDGPWRLWMTVTATESGVAITDLDGDASKRFYRVVD